MRILHVLPALGSIFGGPSRVAISSVQALRLLGCNAEIVTTTCGVAIEGLRTSGELNDYQGVPVRFFPPSFFSYHEFIPSISLMRWLRTSIKNYDAVDLHYLYTFSTTVAARAAYANGVPYTIRAMGQLDPWSVRRSWGRKWMYRTVFDRQLLRHSASVQCTSRQEFDHVTRSGVTNAVMVPLGVDIFEMEHNPRGRLRAIYGLPPDCKIILFMSRFHPKKRPDMVLRVLSRLPSDVYAVLAGSGSVAYLKKLHLIAEKLGIRSRCRFAPHLDGELKEIALQGSDVLLLPSYSENFGVVVAEAMIRELPVLLSSSVGLSDFVAKLAPNLVVDFDTDNAVLECQQILRNDSYRNQIGARLSHAVRSELSWSRAARILLAEYRRLIGSKP